MAKCLICKESFNLDKELHMHLRSHSIRMAEYYQKYFPRKDMHDGEIIKFKNKEYYFSRDFNTKTNLKSWLKKQSEEKKKEYCSSLIEKRIKEKKILHAPTQVELRTIMSPPVQYYNDLFGSYNNFCLSLGLKERFPTYPTGDKASFLPKRILDKQVRIAVDTREQKPIKFSCPTQVRKLDYGDYTLEDEELCCSCHIERKSVKDLIGTMSGGLERFKREIERASENEAYIVVVVERPLAECLHFDRLPYVPKKIKATPDFIFKNIRDLIQSYSQVQFLFVGGREELERVSKKILLCGCLYIDTDLQLAYDLKVL